MQEFFGPNSFLKYPGTIYIKIGKPICDITNVINSKKNLNWMNENYSFLIIIKSLFILTSCGSTGDLYLDTNQFKKNLNNVYQTK